LSIELFAATTLTAPDTSNVIKADQFPTWHGKYTEKVGVGGVLKLALNMRGLDTIQDWAQKLVRQHRPADLLSLPAFMQPKPVSNTPIQVMRPASITLEVKVPPQPVREQLDDRSANQPTATEPAKRLICTHCGAKISFPEGKFCWNNTNRFKGQQYCREHQALF
jgi:hypothetical protein